MLILIMIFALLLVFFIKKYNHIPPKYSKKKRRLIIGNLEIERCDLDYYNILNTNFNIERQWYELPRTIQQVDDIDIPEQYLYDEDSQNVHDTLIVNSSKNTYNKLIKTVTDDDYFLDQFNEKYRAILVKIKERNSFVGNLGKHEWDVIKDVWSDSYTKPNVREQYLKDLEECLDEHDKLYCATGIVNRILSSTHIDEPEKMPKTKDIFKVEILNRFSVLIKTNSKERCREMIMNEYKDLLTEDKLKEIIDEWYDILD